MTALPDMPRTAADGWNAALAAMIALARTSAEALQAIADEAEAMVIKPPPDEPNAVALAAPKPRSPSDGASIREAQTA